MFESMLVKSLLFVVVGCLTFVVGRRWPWAGLLFVPLLQVEGMGQLARLQDPIASFTLRAEHGPAMFVMAFFAVLLGGAVLPAWGAALGFTGRKKAEAGS